MVPTMESDQRTNDLFFYYIIPRCVDTVEVSLGCTAHVNMCIYKKI